MYCALYGIPVQTVPLAEDMRLDVAAYAHPQGLQVAGVVIANPNAPTGIGLALADIELLLQTHPLRVVLVDEAYVDFGGQSAVALIARYPNLLVVHTPVSYTHLDVYKRQCPTRTLALSVLSGVLRQVCCATFTVF